MVFAECTPNICMAALINVAPRRRSIRSTQHPNEFSNIQFAHLGAFFVNIACSHRTGENITIKCDVYDPI